MSAPEAASGPASRPQPFSARTILALVAVGLLSFSGLAVLAAYAPELRSATDPGAHALSSSAVGFRGAMVMLQAEGVPAVISRNRPRQEKGGGSLIVLTPDPTTQAKQLEPFAGRLATLIVLPKWLVQGQPFHLGYVNKVGVLGDSADAAELLSAYSPDTQLQNRTSLSRPILRGVAGGYLAGTYLPLGKVDRLQTISGSGWEPVLVDEQGRALLVRSRTQAGVWVLSDPDMLNNQGLASLDNARAGMAVLNVLRGPTGLSFDVTLNGFTRGRGIGRLMLEPPWLAATLCGVAAALLLGLHGLARFGPTLTRPRAIALGKRALVDNSAGLVRMARREHELAPAYAALTRALIRKSLGGDRAALAGDNERWLADLARLRAAAAPEELSAQAERALTREDLLSVGRKLYFWRVEITGERR